MVAGGALSRTILIGYAATRTDNLVLQIRMMVEAIGADGSRRIDAAALVRLCAAGRTVPDDIDQCGLPRATSPR